MGAKEEIIPHHVALIMDGNRRWAQAKNLPIKTGHEKGVEVLREIVRASSNMGLNYLSVYGFSMDNWKREPNEVDDLMNMMRNFLQKDVAELHKNKVRVNILGNRKNVEKDILQSMDAAKNLTKNNQGLTLSIAFNYGARDEISRITQKITAEGKKIDLAEIDEALEAELSLKVDLLIRTGGEQRLSDFLLWQSAYAELIFIDDFWPDFTPELFKKCLDDYKTRSRRFGGGDI